MKSILLFRHCKQSNGDYSTDHERPLTLDGILDAKNMGLYIARINERPDLVISSTAIRAKCTAETAISEGKWDCSLKLYKGIYIGNLSFLLKLLNNQDNSISTVCLVGHEPTFTNFITNLIGGVFEYFPRGSIAKIDFNVQKYSAISLGIGNLSWFMTPSEL